MIGVLLDAVDQDSLGFVRGHAGDALQLRLLAVVHLVGLGLEALGLLVLVVECFLSGFQIVQFFVKCLFALVHPALQPRHFAAAVTNFFIKLRLQADDFFLGLQQRLFFLFLRLSRGVLQQISGNFLRLSELFLHRVLAVKITGCQTCRQRNHTDDCV